MLFNFVRNMQNGVRKSKVLLGTLAISVLILGVFNYGRLRMPTVRRSFGEGKFAKIGNYEPLSMKQTIKATIEEVEAVSPAKRTLLTLLRSLRSRGARLLLTQTIDLLDEETFLRSSLLNLEVALTRVGVLEENLPALLRALDDLMSHNFTNASRKDIRSTDPRANKKDKKAKEVGKRLETGEIRAF